MSILVVISMAVGLVVSFTPQRPREMETPTPTVVIFTPTSLPAP